jgi:hypothetical protein
LTPTSAFTLAVIIASVITAIIGFIICVCVLLLLTNYPRDAWIVKWNFYLGLLLRLRFLSSKNVVPIRGAVSWVGICRARAEREQQNCDDRFHGFPFSCCSVAESPAKRIERQLGASLLRQSKTQPVARTGYAAIVLSFCYGRTHACAFAARFVIPLWLHNWQPVQCFA